MGERGTARREYGLRDLRQALPFLLGAAGLVLAVGAFAFYVSNDWVLADAHAYWGTGQDGFAGYDRETGALDAYLYSPAFAQLLSVVTWLPWPVFGVAWVVVQGGVLVWLLRPLGWVWAVVVLLWCVPELMLGNIWALLAASIVLALRGHPEAWALPILTKPVLGIGVVWHLARREWRALVVAMVTTVGIVLVSFLIDADMWASWFDFLRSQPSSGLFMARVVVAIAVLVFAARTDRPWLAPIALLIAVPHIGGISVLVLLTAIPRLLQPLRAVGPPAPMSPSE